MSVNLIKANQLLLSANANNKLLTGTDGGLHVLDLTIAAGSASRLSYNSATSELSLTSLGITSVSVDTTSANLAAFIAASYTAGTEFQEGDVVIITTSGETFIHNGGTTGTATDFTVIETPNVTDAYIRNLFSSANTAINYNPATGVFTFQVSANVNNGLSILADGLFYDERATATTYDNTTSGLVATEVQAAIDEIDGRIDDLEALDYINGITKVGTDVKLGTTLTEDTVIPFSTFKLHLNDATNPDHVFSVNGTQKHTYTHAGGQVSTNTIDDAFFGTGAGQYNKFTALGLDAYSFFTEDSNEVITSIGVRDITGAIENHAYTDYNVRPNVGGFGAANSNAQSGDYRSQLLIRAEESAPVGNESYIELSLSRGSITEVTTIQMNRGEVKIIADKDGVGTQEITIDTDSITSDAYPNTRDDSGVTTPVNFLYTDVNGKILSTTLSQILSSEIKDTQTGITGTTLTLPSVPNVSTLKVFRNGVLLDEGAGNDYTVSGAVVTFAIALIASDKIKSFYFN